MLANRDLFAEVEKMELVIAELTKKGKDYEASALKAQVLSLKLLHNIRANTVAVMKKFGIELIKPMDKVTEEK